MIRLLFGFIVGFSLTVMFISCSAQDEEVYVPSSVTAAIDAEDTHKDRVRMQEEIIRRQQQEITKQDREMEDLKRQKYHNESLRRFEKK